MCDFIYICPSAVKRQEYFYYPAAWRVNALTQKWGSFKSIPQVYLLKIMDKFKSQWPRSQGEGKGSGFLKIVNEGFEIDTIGVYEEADG